MQVENIECQIAQAQIGNFLAGSGLSDEAMVQLEEHIGSCSTCKAALASKREELRSMLKPQQAVVDFQAIHEEAQQVQAKSIASALRKRSLQKLVEPPEVAAESTAAVTAPVVEAVVEKPQPKVAKPSSYWKPLAYSLGLGAVLVGMSLFSNNLASVFGPRLSDVAGKNQPVASTTSATNPTTPTTGPSTGSPTPTTQSPSSITTPSTGNSALPVEVPETTAPAILVGKGETSPTQVETPVDTSEATSTTGNSLGATTGALATTQFEASAETPTEAPKVTTPPVQKPVPQTKAPSAAEPKAPAKPVVKPKVIAKTIRKPVVRRIAKVRRPAIRRAVVRRHAPGAGIKIYQP